MSEVNERVQREYREIVSDDVFKTVSRDFNPKYTEAYDTEHFNRLLTSIRGKALKRDEELTEEQKADPLGNPIKFRYNTILKVLNGEDKEKHEKLKEWCEKWGYTFPTLPPGEFEILD